MGNIFNCCKSKKGSSRNDTSSKEDMELVRESLGMTKPSQVPEGVTDYILEYDMVK